MTQAATVFACACLVLWSSSATAQVLVKACVPSYAQVASLGVYNYRLQTPPDAEPGSVPAGVQQHVLTPLPAKVANTALCGPDTSTGYVEFTAPTLGGPGVKITLAAWSKSADGISSTRSNVLVGVALPLAAPVLVP